jgi:thymidine phosphorylase
VVRETGCAIIGQTEDLAPADRRLYAIRDVTGTVESIPLITASILSKKIAAGLDALVMDIKTGSGAFMKSVDDASGLAESIIGTAGSAGLKTHALITDMNECLGTTAGNALEIAESMRFLRDENRDARLNDVVMALCAEMLVVSGIESDRGNAIRLSEQAVSSGRAAGKFDQMVTGLGGPPDFVEQYEQHLPIAAVTQPVFADTDGVLYAMDTCVVGNAIIELGGGRKKLGDILDLSVGFSDVASIGETIDSQRPLAIIHASSEAAANKAAEMFRQACTIGEQIPPNRPTVYKTMAPE